MGREAGQTAPVRPFSDALLQSLRHAATHPAGPHKGKVDVALRCDPHETGDVAVSLRDPCFKCRQLAGPLCANINIHVTAARIL